MEVCTILSKMYCWMINITYPYMQKGRKKCELLEFSTTIFMDWTLKISLNGQCTFAQLAENNWIL